MMFLPNSFERYISSLRLYLQGSVSKKGITERKSRLLKCLYRVEALYYRGEKLPTDIRELSSEFFKSASLIMIRRNKIVSASLYGGGVRPISRKLYILLLSELILLCGKRSEINQVFTDSHIIINISGCIGTKRLIKPIKAMNGTFFYRSDTHRMIMYIPCKKSNALPEKIKNDPFNISNRFSHINIYLENICP